MTNNDLLKAFDIIEKNGTGFFKGTMPEELILKAEKYLSLKFPISFREFLKEKGNGFFRGREFYGLVDDDFESGPIPDAIWLTMNERKISSLDQSLILICESPEYYFAIDTSIVNNGESPVIELIPCLHKRDCEILAPDFGLFFLNEIKTLVNNV
ncbi:MAG: hypothetical protein Ta2G_00520 [Termitinemataceae bacterium]|nr:MAG: hypothetical protein Ta2G_00520 [Termitinemataceae bacterium]